LPAARFPHHAAFASELATISERAAESVGGFDDRYFELAGHSLTLRFAGPALAGPMTMALAHLQSTPRTRAELTVRIWDSRSTSTAPPRPPWSADAYLEHGTVRGYFEDGFYALFSPGTRTLSVLDDDRGEAYFWIDDADRLGLWDRGAPLRTLLHLWLSERGIQLVHAAAVGRPDGCLLLVGNSGAGKSSTALVCLSSELRHLGEDYCLLTPGDRSTISSIYCTAKVETDTLERLPELRELVVAGLSPDYEKALLDLHSRLRRKLLTSAPLRAIAVPAISSRRETRVGPGSRGTALAAVAPSTLLQLPRTGPSAMRRLTDMVSSVPCYELEVGSDPSLIPAALEGMLEGR
jgi:hypothetical protein